MPRRVFFSFHYDRDAWRVSQIRNSEIVTKSFERSTFLDAADWQSIKRQGRDAIQRWIDRNMSGTSVVCVLIGAETHQREWVTYEIEKGWREGRGLFGVSLRGMKDNNQVVESSACLSPFRGLNLTLNGRAYIPKIYNWVDNMGRYYMSDWIESAARDVGR